MNTSQALARHLCGFTHVRILPNAYHPVPLTQPPPCSQCRGDFAAGKMGVAPPTPISLEEFAQFVTDMEGAFEKNGVDADLKPPASEDEIAHIINDDHAPLASLLAWHNGGIPIGEYELSSAHEIPPVEAADLVLPIGKNLDGGELFVQPSTGILFSADEGGTPTSLEMTLADFLGNFRDDLMSNKYEWAGGWISKA